MDRLADLSCSDRTLGEASSTPFDAVFVRLSKAEHIELVRAVNYWKTEHARAAERARRIEALYEERMRQAAGEAAQREAALRAQLDVAEGKVRDLQQRLFGRKSERSSVIDGKHRHRADGTGRRGQRPGAKGHGRSRAKQLPVEAEEVKLESPACPKCGEALKPFPGTEDSELVEIEVRAYRRVIRRQRYRPSCGCKALPGIVTAAPEPRLIPRGKFGISVWVTVLLDKFLYGRPSYRLVQDLADHGLDLPMGTLSGGLQAIAPLFVPVCEALREELRRGRHWHAHETRWEVFADTEGKIGHRWYLWVFKSSNVTFFVLDPSRSAAVVNDVLGGLDGGTISCDRYGAYKKFARLNTGFTLLFCWVHQRRDLLNLANDHPELASWALAWVEFIGEMFAVHAQRAEAHRRGPGPRRTGSATSRGDR